MTYNNNLQSPVSSDAASRLVKPPRQSPVFLYTTRDLPVSHGDPGSLAQHGILAPYDLSMPTTLQLDPGVNFAHYIIIINTIQVAEVVAIDDINDIKPVPKGLDRRMGIEYWKINGKALKSDRFDSITVRRVKHQASSEPPFTSEASFWCPLRPNWIEQELDAKRFAQNYKLDNNLSGFRSNIEFDGKHWIGTIDWMKPRSQDYVFTISAGQSVKLKKRALSNMKISRYTLTLEEMNTLPVPT